MDWSETDSSARVCFHCGLACRESSFLAREKSFCCQGCLTVFQLLTENGLEDYYRLGESAGVRVKVPAQAGQFKFLDETAVRERLVDFTNDRLTKVTLHIPAIHCIACVWLLENLLHLNPGIGQSRVNFPRKEVSITFENEKLKLSELVSLLASLGYEPELKFSDLQVTRRSQRPRRLWLQLAVAGFAFGNIMLFSLSSYLGLDSFNGPAFRKLMGWFSLGLATPVFVFSAADYWRAAWVSIRQRLLTIDVPIAGGIITIYAQSMVEVITGQGEGYFDSLAGLIFFLLCGKWFQQKTYDRLAFDRDYRSFFPLSVTRTVGGQRGEAMTSESETEGRSPSPRPSPLGRGGAATALDGSLPSSATETLPDAMANEDRDVAVHRAPSHGNEDERSTQTANWLAPGEERVSLSQLAVGDRLILRNGELIPADARLVDGPALIDYSFVSGESQPVEKKPDDYLYAGGRQIGGAIQVEVTKAVSQSYLTSLWNQEAFRKDKTDTLDNLTNRYSQHFTKVVIAIALGSGAYWAFVDSTRAVKAFTSVLIVACPCALALAAPFALGTAVRVLGRRKIFLKNAQVVETLARVDAVVFDKTGTLTAAGAGSVTWLGTALSEEEERWFYSITRHSTHPLAVRVGEAIARDYFPEPVRSFLETAGCGMEGSVVGNEIWMGSAAWLESRGARLCLKDQPQQATYVGDAATDAPHTAAAQGSSVHVAINGRYRGCFILASALRPEADKLISQLSLNYELALLSGDNSKERSRFTEVFGSDAHLQFNQSPLNKLDFVRQLQQRGRTVMMVGDGLNDAGALQQSDVGVAVVENVSGFSPASDVIAASSTVPRLGGVLRFAKDTVRVVRAAFLVSATYNVIGVAIAASGRLSPVVCAVLMPLSSITVVALACGATTWASQRGGQGKSFAKNVESRLPHLNYERGPA